MWREISEYTGYYEVSDTGIVRSLDRYVDLANGKQRFYKSRIIKPQINNCGYAAVRLSKDGITKTFYVHRVVGFSYVPNPDNLPEINHINGDKLCNTPDNLQWVSHATNVRHAYTTNLSSNQGKDHTFAVQVIDNSTGVKFETIKATAEYYKINYNTLRNALNGQQSLPLPIDLRKCPAINNNYSI